MADERTPSGADPVVGNSAAPRSEAALPKDAVSGDAVSERAPSEDALSEDALSEDALSEDDRRAAAAATNRKRALEDWEEKKRLWRAMGVPPPLPAKK